MLPLKQDIRKRIFSGVAVFTAIALVTTGVTVYLSARNLTAEAGGDVHVAKVETSPLRFANLCLNGENVDESGVAEGAGFVFDSAYGDDTGRVRWDGVSYENLSVAVSGQVLNARYLRSLTYLLVLSEGVIAAAEEGYLDLSVYYDFERGAPNEIEVPLRAEDFVTGTDGKDVLNFSFRITLGWGEKFHATNPSVFYDGEGAEIPQEEVTAELNRFYETVRMGRSATPVYALTLYAKVS